MAKASEGSLDLEALKSLKSTEPPLWLAPSAELSKTARTASQQLFSFLKTYAPKSPLDRLLVEGFDAEQIWQQIDLQSQPVLSSLKREVKKFEKNAEEIGKIKEVVVEDDKKGLEEERRVLEEESDGFDEELDDDDDDEGEEEDKKDEEEEEDKKDDEEEEDGGSESESKEMDEGEKGRGGIEDEFLRINELQEYLEEDEAREYGLKDSKGNKKKGERKSLDDDDDEDDEDEEDDDDLGMFEDDEDAENVENARYEEFFGAKKKKVPKRKSKSSDESEEYLDLDDEQDDEQDDDGDDDDEAVENQKDSNLSTHEKQLKELQSEIEQMEKANLDPKTWTMQGEVTAAQRPKNSALEVDLDFQHNVRPAPVITEEFTASLEEMIKKRIVEGQFDDVEKAPSLPSKAPRQLKELDENKSKKGLAEVYEEEYVKTTNPAAAPLSFSDEQKKEASMLFKKLCLKLDALSHFHFSPKPVIDDMSIQANVPALAMEEIAPIAVSDAAMLAPEEIFAGKGDVKEEAELMQAERKRRRAHKKRRYKAEAAKRMVKKAPANSLPNQNDGNEE